jgi:hypothetical protein
VPSQGLPLSGIRVIAARALQLYQPQPESIQILESDKSDT